MEWDTETLSPVDRERILAQTLVRQIDWRPELSSTNDLALELASRQDVETPLLVGASRQTAGRGRGSNRWWSPAGALTFSLLLQKPPSDSPSEPLARVSLSAALAVCEALQPLAPGVRVGLKWPNDVYLNGRKAAGILVEVPRRRPVRLVIGIGVNVNNSLASAPPELRGAATSLLDETGQRRGIAVVLLEILKRLGDLIAAPRTDQLRLADRWRTYCLLRDRSVELAVGAQTSTGICHGIDDQGALVLETPTGLRRCFAGIVRMVD